MTDARAARRRAGRGPTTSEPREGEAGSSARARVDRTWIAPMAAALALLAASIATARGAAEAGIEFLARLNLRDPPLAAVVPIHEAPGRALSRRVVLLVVDGLGVDASADLPVLGRLRQRGVDAVATSHAPSLSRPNYVSILTGVPPEDSGVRSNEYGWKVPLDSLLLRLRAVGLETAFATDGAPGIAHMFAGQLDDAALTPWAGGLDRAGLLAVDRRYPMVMLLPGAVDRAGHARGADSRDYREAARAVDAQLGLLLDELDLARDTVVVTADHGHTARGGHGGLEPEVLRVPLVLAGAGVRAGARLDHPRLIDVAPTIAALLGAPAPGHALGRTLVEGLAVDAARAAELRAADQRRLARNLAAIDIARRARAPRTAALLGRLGAAAAFFAALALATFALVRARAMTLDRRVCLVAAAAYPAAFAALLVASGGELSLSSLSSQADVESCAAWVGGWVAAAHLAGALLALRRRAGHVDRLAAAAGLVGAGLLLARLAPAAAQLVLGDPPWLDLPPAPVLFLVPAMQMALAAYATAAALTLGLEVVVFLARVGVNPISTGATKTPARHAGDAANPQRWARLPG